MPARNAVSSDLSGLLELYKDLHSADEPLPAQPILGKVWSDILTNPERVKPDETAVGGSLVFNIRRPGRWFGRPALGC
jgi:hypothetical protein